MKNLRIYRIEDSYIRFLKSRDSRVQDNKGRKRPYVGVVLFVGQYRYFVPMESPKPNHTNIKSGQHIMKLDGGKLGLLGFNNMIPVPESVLISFNIDDEPDRQYAELLRRQATYINRNKADILQRGEWDKLIPYANKLRLQKARESVRTVRPVPSKEAVI